MQEEALRKKEFRGGRPKGKRPPLHAERYEDGRDTGKPQSAAYKFGTQRKDKKAFQLDLKEQQV